MGTVKLYVKTRSHRPTEFYLFGGARRDRTVDLYTASVALSQLSYGPEKSSGEY